MPATLQHSDLSQSVLAGNLAALALRSPGVAALVQSAEPHPHAAFTTADDGAETLVLDGLALCSKRRPLEEAQRFAARIDLERAGGVIVLGFGAGHHVRAIVERARGASLIIVFEPDVALLRAVLEHIDCSTWLRTGQVAFVTDADDARQLASSMQGAEAFLSIGIEIVEHPPSKQRMGDASGRLSRRFADAVGAMRTSVVTTLVQSDVTLRNNLMNIDHYVGRPGINDLAGVAQGCPGIVIAAGPSLQRNVHLLEEPSIRDRVVLVAVQTMLKPLLARGIRPHFVMALDHHEISKRFYEGLTASDVEGVTLVIEPKANPAIPDSFPGEIRVVGDARLEELLGPDVAGTPAKARIKPGATVAHLAYYFAKYLGCSPIVLLGQDLGFTDGQYYADRASIHQTWACELNAFRTLEMFEWERIVRNRRHLRKLEDHLGRPIYTDAQMENYLAHFETDWARDIDAGVRIIDATEGGVRKRGPEIMPLAEALRRFGQRQLPAPLRATHDAAPLSSSSSIEGARARLMSLDREVQQVARLSRETATLLRQIDPARQSRANELITRVHRRRDEVEQLHEGYALIRHLNQTGAFKRFKADRPLMLAGDDLAPRERQQRQIERDAVNVDWIAEVAELAHTLLQEAEAALRGMPKRTRDPAFGDEGIRVGDARTSARKLKVPAVICLPTAWGASSDAPGASALTQTVIRLRESKLLHQVIVLTSVEAAAQRAEAQLKAQLADRRLEVCIVQLPQASREVDARWIRRTARARRWARSCWRGGICGASCFDEAIAPSLLESCVTDIGAPAVLVCGAAWPRVDSTLCDELLARYAEDPVRHPLTFTQAAPGLAPCVLSADLVGKLAEAARAQVTYGTIGGLLSYLPLTPMPDAIARSTCVHVDPALRDAPERFVADTQCALACMAPPPTDRPDELVIELVGKTRPRTGLQATWHADLPDHPPMEHAVFTRAVRDALAANPDVALTLTGPMRRAIAGDPLDHPAFPDLCAHARELGARWIHVRTSGRSAAYDDAVATLLDCDVVSVDLLARTGSVATAITGEDAACLDRANARTIALQRAMIAHDGGLERWIVPRITRCDAAYVDIEAFYDQWIATIGTAAIDALPRAVPGDRIAPLTLPALAAQRARRVRTVCADGSQAEMSGAPG